MGIIGWIIYGLIAGALATRIMPGRNPGGLVYTSVLGIVGALVGGYLGTLMGIGTATGFSLTGFATAVGGALVVLFISQQLRK